MTTPRSNGVEHEHVTVMEPNQPSTGGQMVPPERKPPKALTVPELREEEPDIVGMLFEAEERHARQIATLEIPWRQVPQYDDDGHVLRDGDGKYVMGPFRIRFRRLTQEEVTTATRKAKRIWQVGDDGRRENAPDPTEVGNLMIYTATVPEDKARPGGWDDRRLWDRYKVGNGTEVPSKFLTVGEWAAALQLVNKMAGLPEDERFIPLSENSSDGVGAS